MESRTSTMTFIIDQHDISGFTWQLAWLIAVFPALESTWQDKRGQKKNKSAAQCFLDGVSLVQLFIGSSA